MLRKVVSDQGTGELADVKGYEVAGKTGTAEKIDPLTGQLQRHALHLVVRRLRPGATTRSC